MTHTGGCFQRLIEAYSSNVHVLDTIKDSQQVTWLTIDDWDQAQWADPVLGLIIMRLQEGTQSQHRPIQPFFPNCDSSLGSTITSSWGEVFSIGRHFPKESQEALFQLVLLATYREIAHKGCHNDGHLGLECMLDLMCDHFFWPCMSAQVKEHIEQCHPCHTFKAKQPRAPLENIIATHLLELVHLDYLCLEPGKWKEGRKCSSVDRPLPPICPGICDMVADCLNNS